MIYKPDELYHYGRQGMKWGQHIFGKNDVLKNGNYKLSRYTSPNREQLKSQIFSGVSYAAASIIPGYAFVHNTIAINQNLKTIKSINNSLDKNDYTKKEGSVEKIKDLPKKKNNTTAEQDMRQVNKRIGQQKGKVNNCGYCSITMEMRRRGYDVVARSKASGITDGDLKSWFKNPKLESPGITQNAKETRQHYANRAYDQVCNNIEKYGNGSRGYISITYQGMKSGHAMFWEVRNDKVTIYDAQSGKSGKANDKLISMADPSSYTYARLDNLKLNEQVTETCRSNPKTKKE